MNATTEKRFGLLQRSILSNIWQRRMAASNHAGKTAVVFSECGEQSDGVTRNFLGSVVESSGEGSLGTQERLVLKM
jgi:hypothetical protein